MTEESFWLVFGRNTPPLNFKCMLKKPDYELAKSTGNTLAHDFNCLVDKVVNGVKLTHYKGNGTAYNDKKNVIMRRNGSITIFYEHPANGNGFTTALDGNDTYEFTFSYQNKIIDTMVIQPKPNSVPGLNIHELPFKPVLKKKDFDKIHIRMVDGDKIGAIGHFILF